MSLKTKKQIRRNKGITLIALIITIIVLLILAGVTIGALTGNNGIINKAITAKNKNDIAGIKEELELAVLTAIMQENTLTANTLSKELQKISNLTYKSSLLSDTNTIENLPIEVSKNGFTFCIYEDGNVTEKPEWAGKYYNEDTTVSIYGKNIVVPAGFAISGIIGEYGNIDNGIVIYKTNGNTIDNWYEDNLIKGNDGIYDVQEMYDQFVWIPVETPILDLSSQSEKLLDDNAIRNSISSYNSETEKYPMAITLDGENYMGVPYDFGAKKDDNNNVVGVNIVLYGNWKPLAGISSEPQYVSSDVNNTVGITQEILQDDYNKMVLKVSKNSGFWCGRFETSFINGLNENATVLKGVDPERHITWYKMYTKEKNYIDNTTNIQTEAISSMIYGSQYDQMMIFMKDIKNTTMNSYYIINSLGMGNSGGKEYGAYGTFIKCGIDERYKTKNLYDLFGNVSEATLQGNLRIQHRIIRGETTWYDIGRVSMRNACIPNNDYAHVR